MFNSMMSVRQNFWLFLCVVLWVIQGMLTGIGQELTSEIPLLEEPSEEIGDLSEIRKRWQLDSASSALNAGLLGVAGQAARGLVDQSEAGSVHWTEAQEILLTISLARGQVEQAEAILAKLGEEGIENVRVELGRAFVLYFQDEFQEANEVIENLDSAELDASGRAWLAVLKALLGRRSGEDVSINQLFAEAERRAPNAVLREHFELLRLRESLQAQPVEQATISGLRETVRSMRGERTGFEAARLLAIALYQNGQQDEAFSVLNDHLSRPGIRESGLRSTFLLLMGIISGEDTMRGRVALRQLVQEGSDRELQALGFTLLAQAPLNDQFREEFINNLNDWIENGSEHPLLDRLYFFRGYLRLEDGQYGAAEEDARFLINSFPGSSLVPHALRLMGYISWMRSPPQYRTAADYLNRLRQRLDEGPDRIRVSRLMADCFFLNGDYDSASDAYASLLREEELPGAGSILFQRVLSAIRAERIEDAASVMDEARGNPRYPADALWQAEWNLIDSLKREGDFEAAYQRIDSLLAEDLQPDKLSFILRMEWFRIRLMLESGRLEEVVPEAQGFLERIEALESGSPALSSEILEGLESHTMLILGEAHYRLEQSEEGARVFNELREAYPGSGPATLSFLIEARGSSVADSLVSAQQSLIQLADMFPESEYAPIALWEAALNAEQRGLNQHLQQAITILEDLVTEYPDHRLVYYARLKQGDLSRRLNDFGTALLLYERLLSTYPDHPERFRAEMSRSDCLFAMGNQDSNRLEDASVVYERLRLLERVPFPVRVEAAYKFALCLRQQGDAEGYREALYLVYDRFLSREENTAQLRRFPQARYWMSRSLLDLGDAYLNSETPSQARIFFEAIIDRELPGTTVARGKLEALSS